VGIVEASGGVWWIVSAAGTHLNYSTIKILTSSLAKNIFLHGKQCVHVLPDLEDNALHENARIGLRK
jgi:hypothetical protein